MTENEFYLATWLDEATNSLCDDARERVTREVRSHYEDRVAAERAKGHSEDEAHALAMAGLGNSAVARKAYSRVHLTRSDVQSLEFLLARQRGWRLSRSLTVAAGMLFFAACSFPGYLAHGKPLLYLVACGAWSALAIGAFVLKSYGFSRALRHYRNGHLRAAIAWCWAFQSGLFSVHEMLLGYGIFLMPMLPSRLAVVGAMLCLTLVSAGVWTWMYFRLSRKLCADRPGGPIGMA